MKLSTLTARIGSSGGAVEEQVTNKKEQRRKGLRLFFHDGCSVDG